MREHARTHGPRPVGARLLVTLALAAALAPRDTSAGGLFFTDRPQVRSFADVMACDAARFKRFFHAMLEGGVNLAPSAYEAGFVSSTHGPAELAHTFAAAERAFAALA